MYNLLRCRLKLGGQSHILRNHDGTRVISIPIAPLYKTIIRFGRCYKCIFVVLAGGRLFGYRNRAFVLILTCDGYDGG